MRNLPLGLTALLLTSMACKRGKVGDTGDGDGGGGDGGFTESCPNLEVSQSELVFSPLAYGASATLSVVLTNACSGAGDLEVAASISGDPAFIASLPAVMLAPGQGATVEVLFQPSDFGEFSAELLVQSNDVDLSSVTIPVSGSVIADADGDGFDSEAAGGDDCDDRDASVYPREAESSRDLRDDDCDGLVDEDWIEIGDVYVSEVMLNPKVVTDGFGEWFEVRNGSAETVDLMGWTVRSDDGQAFTVEGSLRLAAGEVAVFGVSADAALNGGVTVAYAYDRTLFSLSDSADSIFLYLGSMPISELSYTTSWPIGEGASLSLDPMFSAPPDIADSAVWCLSTSTYGGGDLGTPGAANDYCSSVDHDGDGYSVDDGDCDDRDAALNPAQRELWNAIDDDCDGLVDVFGPEDANSQIRGQTGDALGGESSLAVGDFTGDGTPDVLVGGTYVGGTSSTYPGAVALISGTGWSGWNDTWNNLDTASFSGIAYYNALSYMSATQGDQNGDGTLDVFIAGTDIYSGTWYGNPKAAALFFGGGLTGALDVDDADVTLSGSSAYAGQTMRVNSSLDFDGDGFSEVAYGDPNAAQDRNFYVGKVNLLSGADLTSGDYDLDDDARLTFYGNVAYAMLGITLQGADIDGDGYDELLVGAPGYTGSSTSTGNVYVIPGNTRTLGGTGSVGLLADTVFSGESTGTRLGAGNNLVVADLDGDGKLDLALPATGSSKVYVFYDARSRAGTVSASSADATLSGTSNSYFGTALFGGDVNADGIDDLFVGAPQTSYYNYASSMAAGPGEVTGYLGGTISGSISSTSAALRLVSDAKDAFGFNINGADFNGDGRVELLINAPSRSSATGTLFLYSL